MVKGNNKSRSKFGTKSNVIIVAALFAIGFILLNGETHNMEKVEYFDGSYLGHNYMQQTQEEMSTEEKSILTVPIVIHDPQIDIKKQDSSSKVQKAIRVVAIKDFSKPESRGAGRKPLLLTGWNEYQKDNQLSSEMKLEKFNKVFGNYTQYLKNEKVQPLKDVKGRNCLVTTSAMIDLMQSSSKLSNKEQDGLLFFTNDFEAPEFFRRLKKLFVMPSPIDYTNDGDEGFNFFSGMVTGSFHAFHRHDDSQIHQIHGRKMWWFMPPEIKTPKRVNPCSYLTEHSLLPPQAWSVLQQPGDTIFVPKNWWHATCALEDWTVAVGQQRSSPQKLNQSFKPLKAADIDETIHPMPWASDGAFRRRMVECGVKFDWSDLKSWTWFEGDLNDYYNTLIESDSKRNPNVIKSYAVHRWLGKERSTLIHYELIYSMIRQHVDQSNNQNLRLLDAGCGLGAGLMWFETNVPEFTLVGHTISSAQLDFINKLPAHKFNADLKSYDDLDAYKEGSARFNAIYSIEAFVHSPDERNTLKTWAEALDDEGIIVIIDDFLSVGVDKEADDVQLYAKSWMSNVLQTTTSLADMVGTYGLELIVDRDLGSEYQVIKNNYQNKLPNIQPTAKKNHQGWLGSGMRQKLTIEGKLTYRMVVLKKKGSQPKTKLELKNVQDFIPKEKSQCATTRSALEDDEPLVFDIIKAEHRTGKGKDGGDKQQCISGWYCCGKGLEWFNNLEENRTHNTEYLKLSDDLFGDYMEKMVEHLNSFYQKLPSGITGKFLDIGGTGSVVSGMSKVTSKFAHFSGPFDYWMLDSDPAAEGLQNALHCDMADCPEAQDCGFDVTFSHTVLEHSSQPWKVFDTIARITKKGGLTMHVVPFSYQYHATPDDHFRFSHKALTSLLEDRGFKVLDVGYDICTKPEKVLKNNVDEHFDVIWLAYVVGQKI